MIIDTFFTHWDFFQTRFETAVSVFFRLFSGIAIFNHGLLYSITGPAACQTIGPKSQGKFILRVNSGQAGDGVLSMPALAGIFF